MNRAASSRAVVAGEALIDLVPGEEGGLRPHLGGGPFTAARAMARLGLASAYLGRLSRDRFGGLLAECLRADGVDISLALGLGLCEQPTTLALAELDASGRAVYRFYAPGTSAPLLTPELLPAVLDADVRVLHLGTLGLVFEPMATTLTGLAERESAQRLLFVDLNIRPGAIEDAARYRARLDRLIGLGAVVQASDADLAWLRPAEDVVAAGRHLLDRGARLILITLGGQGALACHGGHVVRVPAPPVDVVDTIGAGDAFGAAFLAFLDRHNLVQSELALSTEELRNALRFAVTVASTACTRAGANPPWAEELPVEAGEA